METAVEESRVSRMPVILDFVPTNCVLKLSEGTEAGPRLIMGLKMGRHSSICRPNGEQLKGVEWSLELYNGGSANERLKSLAAIGLLNHYPSLDHEDVSHGELGAAWAHVAEATFDRIAELASRNALPAQIRLHVTGLTYGCEPDGSGKVWDTKATPNAPLQQIEFSFALVSGEGMTADADDEKPVVPAHVRNIEQALKVTIPAQLRSLEQITGWLLAVAVFAAAALVLR